jgi:tetratricopeptide (TPR) repeat protein
VAITLFAGLTVWHMNYSLALAEARAAYDGIDPNVWKPSWWRSIEASFLNAPSPQVQKRRRPSPTLPLSQPDYTLALRRALDYLATHPRDAQAARLAALCLSRLDYAKEAEDYYSLARHQSPLTIDDQHVRAMGLARGNYRDQAIAAYKEILVLHPDDPEALQRLAAIYYSQSQYKETLAVAQRLSESTNTSRAVAGYALIGIVHHDEHRPGPAVAANEKVIELDPDLKTLTLPADLFFADLAQDLIDIGRGADARRYINRALGQREDPVLIDILGSAYYAEGEEDNAEQCWKRASQIDPRFHRPWLNLGKLALRRGQLADALPYLEKAHSIDPKIYEPAYQLSLAYRRLGRTNDSERFRKLAELLRQKNPQNNQGMGTMPHGTP